MSARQVRHGQDGAEKDQTAMRNSFMASLQACAKKKDLYQGSRIHANICDTGLLKKDTYLGNTLVSMYAKCGALDRAQQVVDELPVRDVVTWTALIAGYVQYGQGKEAIGCFFRMQSEGLSPDAFTYSCILKACGCMQNVDVGKQIHDDIVSKRLLNNNTVLGNALVDMYAKCGLFMKAHDLLDELPVPNVVSWTALIAGYVQHGQGKEALGCFYQMQSEGLSPNAITYSCILKACGILRDIDTGKQIHDEIARQRLLVKNVVLGNALVDMYAKCGVLLKAQEAFDELLVHDAVSWNALIAGYAEQGQGEEALVCFQRMRSEGFSPNVVSWTALIGGYAQQGQAKEALNCFQWMQEDGILPDAVTFVNVLNACSRSGLVDQGQMYFDKMRETYGIAPDKEHYTLMVVLLGCARLFDKALRVVMMMPSFDHPPVWSALLGACKKWGNVKLGRFAFERAVQLDERNAAAYVSMSDIYVAAGMQEEAQTIESMRRENAAWKQSGHTCWVDASGNVHKFVAKDTMHPQSRQIYAKLQDLEVKCSQQGCLPNLNCVSQSFPQHSEKLAIACAIINTPDGKDLRIMDNMQVCGDCHATTSLISKIENRKIMVKDANCLHTFENGQCCCDVTMSNERFR